MSSSLTLFACIENVDRVISCLHQLNEEEELEKHPETGKWDLDNDQWTNWENESESKKLTEEESADDKGKQKTWLQDCCIGFSPCEDLIAIGREDRLVILTAKWDRQATSEPKTKFEIAWTGQLALDEGECVSSLLCLPLASQHSRSSQGFPDWTCIVAGFTSGYIRFYLQDGSLLLHQLLHEDAVLKLKCQTWQPDVSRTDFEQVEELAILYPTALVLLDGFSLYQSLRGCRNQLARAQASGTGESINPPPLAYKKWNLKGQGNISDIASCGIVTPSLFDQLQTASFIGGCDASIRVTPPAMSQFVTSGSDPFVGFYSGVEGGSPPLISDVALEVATKLTSAVLSKLSVASGWLGWRADKPDPKQSQDAKKRKPKVEKGTSLPLRYSLSDQRRDGISITLSPDERLAATTDEFGRVMLMSVKEGLVLRTWKGYRDAECGWIPVQEEHHDIEKTEQSSEQARRTALFLIIYAPRRGILEVWTAEYGPRAAAFNVGRDCRFLYTGHHILGSNHDKSRESNDNTSNCGRCVLLQPNGSIKNLTVPFHCALSDKFSRRVRDLHLLKKLSSVLDQAKEEKALKGRTLEKLQTTVLEILTSIQVPVLLQQGLQCVLSTVGLPVSLLEKAISSVTQNITKKPNVSDDHEHEDDCDIQALVEFTRVQEQVIQMYNSLCQEKSRMKGKEGLSDSDPTDGEDKIQWLASLLCLTVSEAAALLCSIENYWELAGESHEDVEDHRDVTPEITITNFLSCFEITKRETGKKSRSDAVTSSEKCGLRLRMNLSSETLAKLGNFLYKETFCGSLSCEKLCLILDTSNILPANLLDLLMFHWLFQESKQMLMNISALLILYNLISSISSMTGGQNGADQQMSLTAWWEKLRHQLAQSTVTSQTLAAAVCCRSIVMEKQTAARKLEDDDQESKEADWVSISMEMERWNLFVNQLDDVLNLVIFCLSLEVDCQMKLGKEEIRPSKCAGFLSHLTVLNILGRDQSGIAEVVARCVVRHAVEPGCLGYPCTKRRRQARRSTEEDRPEEIVEEPDPSQLLSGLLEIRKRFRYSLAQDNLWAHCSYEYLSHWLGDKELSGSLLKSLEHVKCIDDQRLKHGLCVLMWHKVKDSVSAMTTLTEKVGKAPKERLCIKTVEMGCSSLTIFLKATRSILQFLAEMSHEISDETDQRTQISFEVEDFWQTGESSPTSFLQEATEIDPSSYEVVAVHYWLVSLLWLTIGLGMKSVKPLSLVTSKERKVLFKKLNTFYECGDVEPVVSEEREKFFPKALSALVQLLSSEKFPPVMTEHEIKQSSDEWSTAIYGLAEQGGVDLDPLKVHFVCELCSAGMDNLAQEAFVVVRDKSTLCSKLLKVVGQRMAEHIFDSRDPSETARILSRLPMPVSSWIRKQDPSKLRKKGVALSHLNELMPLILNGLPDDSKEHSIATSLTDTLKTIT